MKWTWACGLPAPLHLLLVTQARRLVFPGTALPSLHTLPHICPLVQQFFKGMLGIWRAGVEPKTRLLGVP